MAESPTGIVPEELMVPGATAGVMEFLARLWVDGDTKADLLRGWAMEVRVRVSASQVNAVRHTGTDAGGPTR
jgi:hypothetical protein